MTFDMSGADGVADAPDEDGARLVTSRDVEAPDADVSDVIAYAIEQIVALRLSPGDAIANDAICVLLGLPPNAHRHHRQRIAWMALVNSDEGLMMRLSEAGVHTRPGRARWRVMPPDEACEFYRDRAARASASKLERGIGFVRTIKPATVEESKRLGDEINRMGLARERLRWAMDRRRKVSEQWARLRGESTKDDAD